MEKLPYMYQKFTEEYPAIYQAHENMAQHCHQAGPLEEKTRQLIKIAVAAAVKSEGAVHSHTRQALRAGATADEIRHAILLTATTIGFPNMMAAFSWVDETIELERG
jgi:AhpD family alkylhydroperoxidase